MRDANRINEIKRLIEWPVLIAAMTSVLLLGTVGCADDPLGLETARFGQVEVAEQEQEQEQDAAGAAAERQRDKNARNNGAGWQQ